MGRMADVVDDHLDETPGGARSVVTQARPGDEGPRRPEALLTRLRAVDPSSWVTLVVVGALVVFTLVQLSPSLILRDTTPTGGDMGAHVWGPAFLRDHLLPKFRLSGWSPDWYLGFPAYHFYMVIPALAVILFDVVLPYGIALKLVSVMGIATLPIAAWAMGKLAGLRFPFPPLLAAGATLFLFDENFTIYGGNIASTMAGEFSFSIALSLALLYLGVLAHGLRTGRHRALTAGLLALCALCHLIVSFFALAGTAVMFLLHADRHRFRYLLTIAPVVGLLVAFWMLPFWWRQTYMTDMAYEKVTTYVDMFFPGQFGADVLLLGLALAGFVGALVHHRRLGVFLGVMAIGYAIWARYWPQGHLWNARLLPFLYLCRYLLALMGVGELALWALSLWRRRPQLVTYGALVVPALAAVVVMGIVGMGMRWLPGGKVTVETEGDTTKWVYHWGPFSSERAAVVDDWARWNYTGYEGKDHYGEYRDVVTTMAAIGETRGCGTALWENNNATNSYGTPMALMLLPFWTDGCIGSSEGLFFEASATTPYHFLSAAALSAQSSNPVRRLPYVNGDVDRGVHYLQQLGIRYYLAFSPSIVAQADEHPDLVPIGTSGPWHIYEVEGAALVEGLPYEPAVVEGVQHDRSKWLDVAVERFTDIDGVDQVPRSASGPDGWQRVAPGETPELRTQPPVTVTDIRTDTDTISFRVDQPGVPVVVRASYFPNWRAEGADGPYRLAPNLMVVVPTDDEVTLQYGRTPVDLVAYSMTGLGLVGLVLLWRRGPMTMPPLREPAPRDDRGPGSVGPLFDWDEPGEPDEVPDEDVIDDEVWEQLSRVLGSPEWDDPPDGGKAIP